MPSFSKLLRYGVVGVIGAVVHMSTLFLLVELGLTGPVVATTTGFVFALLISYGMNRIWTFGYVGSYWASLIRYCIVSLIGLGLNILIIKLFTALGQHIWSREKNVIDPGANYPLCRSGG